MKRFVVRIRLPYDDSDDPEDYTVTTFAETQERARRILIRTELCCMDDILEITEHPIV